jgi:hypothetical protein
LVILKGTHTHAHTRTHTLFTTMSVTFKCCTVAQYTHICNLICAHKKSKVFTYADFRGGGMHHSIMFISLILNFTQINQTTNVDSTHANSFAPFSKAWLPLQHLSQHSQVFNCISRTDRQTSPTPNITVISQDIWKVYTEIHLRP